MKYLKLCRWPLIGFGKDAGKPYLLDIFGKIYRITNEYDEHIQESYLSVELRRGVYYNGTDLEDLLETISLNENCKIEPFNK